MAKVNEDFYTIENLKQKHKTANAVFNGVCAMMGWQRGKMLKEAEYTSAIKKWLGGLN